MSADLEICGSGHDPIAFSRILNCPVCAAKEETRESDKELSAALAKIDKLKEEIETLKEGAKQ